MHISYSNTKLGDNCLSVSRPVGVTCPSTCEFLGNVCYAEQMEKRFPNVRKAASKNLSHSVEEISNIIQECIDKKKDLRIHVLGDFYINGKLDKVYLSHWKKSLSKFQPLPIRVWTYTHVLHSSVADLQNYGCQIYASVHNEQDVKKAMEAGFSLFAYVVKDKKKKGGSKDYPKRVDIPLLGTTTVCPEQIRGRSGTKAVTCTGSKDSIACTLCCRGFSNIVFLTH